MIPASSAAEHPASAAGEGLRGIAELARELGVTARTIRFYEDKGLITPQRAGTTRVYTRRDQARLKLILRGKRLGFSLRQIAEFLDLYDVDSTHQEQMRALIGAVHERIGRLREQRRALEQTLDELIDIERQALARLGSGGGTA